MNTAVATSSVAEYKPSLSEQKVATSKTELLAAKAELAVAEQKLETGETKLAAAKTELETVEKKLTSAKSINDEDLIESARAQLKLANRSVETSQSEVDSCQNNVNSLRSTVIRLRNEISTSDTTNNSISSDLRDPRVDNLVSELKAVKLDNQQIKLDNEKTLIALHHVELDLHRMKHTITEATDIGKDVLNKSICDFNAVSNYLPGLSLSIQQIRNIINKIPKDFDRNIYQRIKSYNDNTDSTDSKESKLDESIVQANYMILFNYLLDKLKSKLFLFDTSVRGYLIAPIGKIDFTFCSTNNVLWSILVTLGELKVTLSNTTPYHTAIGQVIDRCYEIFSQQRDRQFITCFILGSAELELFIVKRDGIVIRTGKLPLAYSDDNGGFRLLLRVLSASQSELGYISPSVPAPFTDSSQHRIEDFTLLRASQNERMSSIYSASRVPLKKRKTDNTATTAIDSNSSDIVVKFSPERDTQTEVDHLINMQGCLNVPRLISYGKLSSPIDHFYHYFCIAPNGAHLTGGMDIKQIYIVMSDILKAMKWAYETQNKLLHCDISTGNIIYEELEAPPFIRGILIDWHVARNEGNRVAGSIITGTRMFTSLSLRYPNHQHNLLDDIESLFYSFISIITEDKIHWKHSDDNTIDAMKLEAMTIKPIFMSKVLQRCFSSELIECVKLFHSIIFPNFSYSETTPSDSLIILNKLLVVFNR